MSGSNIDDKRWFITQGELDAWLDGISVARTLIAPRLVSGIILYQPVARSDEIAWRYQLPKGNQSDHPVLSAKEFFFPPSERLFLIHKKGVEIQLEETFPDWEIVVFGVQPCDAHGVKILDALFLDTNPVDPFYARRRGNTTLIGLACSGMNSTCFCTSVGGAPDNSQDMDIMLYEVNGGYLAEAITEKGRFLIPGGEWKETATLPQKSTETGQKQVSMQGSLSEHFNDKYWSTVSDRCLSCRACAYVCPTCRCFVVRDEMIRSGEFERIRCWDSCAGENYRLLAGGHKPRAEKSERLRNRFYCKYLYFSKQYGLGASAACTGCGRCIEICPAGVDITEIMQDLEKEV
jgi:sulfhydrogenase subunit beta (sulfur reductase)